MSGFAKTCLTKGTAVSSAQVEMRFLERDSRSKGCRDGPSDEDEQVHLEIWEGDRSKRDHEQHKGDPCEKSPASVQLSFVVAGGWMSEPEEEDQGKRKKPRREKEKAENTEAYGGH